MLLTTLICVTVVLIGLLILAINKNDADLVGFSMVMLFLTGFLGWLVLGTLVPQSKAQETLTLNVLHDKNSVHISLDGRVIRSFTDVANFNYLIEKNETKVLHTIIKNMYGGMVEEKWELVP